MRLIFQIVRHALVRRKHEFFDQAMRDVAFRASNALHQPELVELDDRLGQVEVDRSAALAFAIQNQRQVAHQLEGRDQRRIAFAQLPHRLRAPR